MKKCTENEKNYITYIRDINTTGLVTPIPTYYDLDSILIIRVTQVRMDQGLAVKIRCPMRS